MACIFNERNISNELVTFGALPNSIIFFFQTIFVNRKLKIEEKKSRKTQEKPNEESEKRRECREKIAQNQNVYLSCSTNNIA